MPTAKKTKTRKKSSTKKAAAKKTAAPKSAVGPILSGTSLESRFLEPLAEMEKMFSNFRRGDLFRSSKWDLPEISSMFEDRMPSIDVVDRAKEILVKAEIPGIDEDDLEVSVTGHTLTIKGDTRHEEETEEGDLHRREIHRGSYFRTLTLPSDVDGAKAKAKCKNGMLELHLPKAGGAKKHSISVS